MTDEEKESKLKSLKLFEETKKDLNENGIETPSLDRMIEILKQSLKEK